MDRWRVALVGPMGSGKTTVGKALSGRIGARFVDLDDRIVKQAGMSIPDIFRTRGESGFRELEAGALAGLTREATAAPCVCATGGGIVTSPGCRQLLRESWDVVYLEATVATLVERLRGEVDVRPMLKPYADRLAERIQQLQSERAPWYLEVADVRISVDGRGVADIVEDIMGWLSAKGEAGAGEIPG
ncbi:MAG: shikimate kinase [Alicyclobacillus sp.]|nr:shikimate kinase [Alicyclobacillus sp.]